tara:strand:+ start:896 stop:1645 length:750 start_codon:yes stop_codon:yes gene_type:complete
MIFGNKRKVLELVRKKIKFIAIEPKWLKMQPAPKPAVSYKPTWYKESPLYSPGNKFKFTKENKNMTFKKCLPFIDGINAGYILELRKDIFIQENSTDESNTFDITWNSDELVIGIHHSNTKLITPPEGYHSQVVTYIWNYIVQTPKGYSTLFCEPLGYQNGVLKAIPAVVDTDAKALNFHLSLHLRKGFTGLIPKGTPLVQIIPFKRESWTHEVSNLELGEHTILQETTFNATIFNNYRDLSWSKKDYK